MYRTRVSLNKPWAGSLFLIPKDFGISEQNVVCEFLM